MNMNYSLETSYQIWNDSTGERIEVSPDRDALGLVEIRSITDDGKPVANVVLNKEQVRLLIQALSKMLDQLES